MRILHLPCAREGVARDNRCSRGYRAIGVMDIGDVGVLVDDRDVGNLHDVDVAHVGRRMAVPRYVRFVPAQRHPAHCRAARDRQRQVRAADKRHQRRRINRARHACTGRPRPAAADPHPAAIVIWGEAPRRVVHPRPAPGRHPHPAAITIRCPTHRYRSGKPHVAVLRNALPGAVLIELFVAGHGWRYVAWRNEVFILTVARVRPVVEFVGWRRSGEIQGGRGEGKSLVVVDRHRCVAGQYISLALTHQYGGGGARRVDTQAITAGQ